MLRWPSPCLSPRGNSGSRHNDSPGSAGDFAAQDDFALEPGAPNDGRRRLFVVEPPRHPAGDRRAAAVIDAGAAPFEMGQPDDEGCRLLPDRVSVRHAIDPAAFTAMKKQLDIVLARHLQAVFDHYASCRLVQRSEEHTSELQSRQYL